MDYTRSVLPTDMPERDSGEVFDTDESQCPLTILGYAKPDKNSTPVCAMLFHAQNHGMDEDFLQHDLPSALGSQLHTSDLKSSSHAHTVLKGAA
jgi:hypothetical protein